MKADKKPHRQADRYGDSPAEGTQGRKILKKKNQSSEWSPWWEVGRSWPPPEGENDSSPLRKKLAGTGQKGVGNSKESKKKSHPYHTQLWTEERITSFSGQKVWKEKILTWVSITAGG